MRDVNAGGRARRHRMSAGQRRESILKAAIEVFTTAGYRAGKVSDVAARVGVTEPVIFQNFGSKAALFAAVLDRVAEDLRTELDTLVERHGSATELLAHVLSPPHTHQPDRPTEQGLHLTAGRGPHLTAGREPDLPTEQRPHLTAEWRPHLPSERGPHLSGRRGPLRGDVTSLAGEPEPSDLGPLFADAVSLTAESEHSEPARRILSTLAGHLTDLLRRGQADGDIRTDLDAEAGAWLVLSILAARPLRAAMPDGDRLDAGVAALALQAVVRSRSAGLPG